MGGFNSAFIRISDGSDAWDIATHVARLLHDAPRFHSKTLFMFTMRKDSRGFISRVWRFLKTLTKLIILRSDRHLWKQYGLFAIRVRAAMLTLTPSMANASVPSARAMARFMMTQALRRHGSNMRRKRKLLDMPNQVTLVTFRGALMPVEVLYHLSGVIGLDGCRQGRDALRTGRTRRLVE
jgi:hypothetical protein